MTDAEKHAPTPWRVDEGPNAAVYVAVEQIGVGAVLLVQPRQPRPRVPIAKMCGPSYQDDMAAAALIARAVNAHEALVAALETALREGAGSLSPSTLEAGRAALALARGES